MIIKFYKATELTLVFKYVFIYFVENIFFPHTKAHMHYYLIITGWNFNHFKNILETYPNSERKSAFKIKKVIEKS